MELKETIKEIENLHKKNPQYIRLSCLYDNREKRICPKCIESKKGCKKMLEAFKYPPYNNR